MKKIPFYILYKFIHRLVVMVKVFQDQSLRSFRYYFHQVFSKDIVDLQLKKMRYILDLFIIYLYFIYIYLMFSSAPRCISNELYSLLYIKSLTKSLSMN